MEHEEDFQRLYALMNAYEQEGEVGPVKVGEQAFAWAVVIQLCENILQRAADIRVAIWWIQALIKEKCLSDLLIAFRVIDHWLVSDITVIDPRAEEDENHLEILALNLSWLGTEQFIGAITQLRIVQGGDLRLGQIILASDRSAFTENFHNQISEIHEIFLRFHVFMQKIESSNVYGLERSIEYLGQLLSRNEAVAPINNSVELSETTIPAVIKSREEVARAIEKVIAYFHQVEPAHPAPILLERVQRMLGASFHEIMKELYADGSQLVSRIERPQGN